MIFYSDIEQESACDPTSSSTSVAPAFFFKIIVLSDKGDYSWQYVAYLFPNQTRL